MWVYENGNQCDSGGTPSAIGQLYADDTCRTVEVTDESVSGGRDLLPGNYSATCLSNGQVQITESGCVFDDCRSASGAAICDRGLNTASLFSRLNPPTYNVQNPIGYTSLECLVLQSQSAGLEVVFIIFGDCVACLNGGTPSPVAPPTPAPATPEPTLTPTVAPADIGIPLPTVPTPLSPPPSPSPVAEPSPRPTRRPVSDPSPVGGSDPVQPPTPMPTLLPPLDPVSKPVVTPLPTFSSTGTEPDPPTTNSTSEASGSSQAVVIGASVGVAFALVLFLIAGFWLGKRLQQRKDEQSRKSEEYAAPTFQQSSSSPPFIAYAGTDREITVDRTRDDDISMLEDPTVLTKDSVLGTHFIDDDPTASVDVDGAFSTIAEDNSEVSRNMFSKASTRMYASNKSYEVEEDDVSFGRPYLDENDLD